MASEPSHTLRLEGLPPYVSCHRLSSAQLETLLYSLTQASMLVTGCSTILPCSHQGPQYMGCEHETELSQWGSERLVHIGERREIPLWTLVPALDMQIVGTGGEHPNSEAGFCYHVDESRIQLFH